MILANSNREVLATFDSSTKRKSGVVLFY